MSVANKLKLKQKRRWRIRKKIIGTDAFPRLSLKFTNNHIIAQCIDDEKSLTMVSITTNDKDTKSLGLKSNISSATSLGKLFGDKARKAGITKVCFDRNGKPFHGKVKAFATACELLNN